MAQNDFFSEFAQTGSVGFGSSVLNSSLSSPLNTSIQCRSLDPNRSFANSGYPLINHFWVSPNKDGGAYVNIPYTKSVSQRIWVRLNYVNNSLYYPYGGLQPGSGVALMFKHSLYNSILNFNWEVRPNSGYELYYGNSPFGSRQGLRLRFGGYRNNVPTENNLGSGYDISTGISFTNNTWIGIRMDVIPVKVDSIINGITVPTFYKDIIKVYTASPATPNTWNLVYSTEITTNDLTYVPWGSYNIEPSVSWPGGADYQKVDAHYGFGVRSESNTDPNSRNLVYWDDYQIYVKNAF